jgi:hypothetical protein
MKRFPDPNGFFGYRGVYPTGKTKEGRMNPQLKKGLETLYRQQQHNFA